MLANLPATIHYFKNVMYSTNKLHLFVNLPVVIHYLKKVTVCSNHTVQ
jgi:hypothetical protein